MKKRIYTTCLLLALTLLPLPLMPSTNVNACSNSTVVKFDNDLGKYFEDYDGCFVLFDQNKNEYTVYNYSKADKRVPPCSTFKIVNSLIGLETGILTNENSIFKWDGTNCEIEGWNKDQTLKSAVSNSCVWCFKRLATQIGSERMQEYLDKFNYGNRDISSGLNNFWLQNSLLISPFEQLKFIIDFYNYLPCSKRSTDIVKNIITLIDNEKYKLSGKTGTGMWKDEFINGWFVGYVERDGNVYFFATNIEGTKNACGPKAKEITLKIFADRGIIG